MNLHAVRRSTKHADIPVMDGLTYDRLMDLERAASEDPDDYIIITGYLTDIWMEDNVCLGLFTHCGDPYVIEIPDYSAEDVQFQNERNPNGISWGWDLCEDYIYTRGPR